MTAYYNEINPEAAAWLRELIRGGHIPDGDIDERSIEDVRPDDLVRYTQCHFFAGIGGWALALRRSGWPENRAVWTGSCPCQPFSSAGKRKGTADERHLWPAFLWHIRQQRPPIVFGEQVANGDGLAWLDLVSSDLEAEGYACGPVVFPACGVGAPQIRQRIYWVACAPGVGRGEARDGRKQQKRADGGSDACRVDNGVCNGWGEVWGDNAKYVGIESDTNDGACGMADLHGNRRHKVRQCIAPVRHDGIIGNGTARGLADGQRAGLEGYAGHGNRIDKSGRDAAVATGSTPARGIALHPGPTNGFWRDADWLFFRDALWRPVEPGTFPLADGIPARVGRLRGYGNAIVIPQAVAFIRAFIETERR